MSSALKFWVAAAAAVAVAVGPILASGPLDFPGLVNVLVAAGGAIYVYLQRNDVTGTYAYAKTLAHAVAAVGVILVSVLSGGISPVEWIQVGATLLGTLGVFGLRNKA
jgi:hypothetical protein